MILFLPLLLSISYSRLGILCFIGVVKSFAANVVANLGDIKASILPESIITCGIFND
jgi:hypothetical protein